MNANKSRQTISPAARQILSIASNSRCDADAKHLADPGASFTDPKHRRRIDAMVSAGLLEVVSVGKWAGLKEYNARLTNDGVALLDGMIYRAEPCRNCGRVHY